MKKMLFFMGLSLFFAAAGALPLYAVEEVDLVIDPTPQPTVAGFPAVTPVSVNTPMLVATPQTALDTPTQVPRPAPAPKRRLVAKGGARKVMSMSPAALSVLEEYGFLAPEKSAQDGTLARSASGTRTLFGTGDDVVLELAPNFQGEVLPGETFIVYREKMAVTHPLTHKFAGYLVKPDGSGVVDKVEGRVLLGHLTRSTLAVRTHDLFVLQGAWRSTLAAAPAKTLRGAIVQERENRQMISAGNIVYIDLGSDRGVLPADTFRIVKAEPVKGHRKSSLVVLGSLHVLATLPQSSVAVVDWTKEPITAGARIEKTE